MKKEHGSNLFALRKRATPALSLIVWLFLAFSVPDVHAQIPQRDVWQQPVKIMDSLGIRPGMVIGEAGAGTGYFTFHLSKRVGENGTIYANDIDTKALQKIEGRCSDEGVRNIVTVTGAVDDPLFPAGKLDGVVIMMAFHDFEKPVEWMKNVMPALRPGAFLAIIDPDPEKINRDRDHFWTKEKVLATMAKTEFKLVRLFTFLERDNIYLYKLNEMR
jgi:ubiquinone/menaquinone biosynthesis C-methylase UbiE